MLTSIPASLTVKQTVEFFTLINARRKPFTYRQPSRLGCTADAVAGTGLLTHLPEYQSRVRIWTPRPKDDPVRDGEGLALDLLNMFSARPTS